MDIASYFEWMYWCMPTAIVFSLAFFMIFLLAALYKIKPSKPRKGFLPIPTQRGDRIFFGLIAFMTIGLIWLATPYPIEYVLIPASIAFIVIFIWG